MIGPIRIPGALLLIAGASLGLSAVDADAYWERQERRLPKGTQADTGGGDDTLYPRWWRIEGRVLHTRMRAKEISGDLLSMNPKPTPVSTYSAMSAWSLPPEQVEPGNILEIRCSIHATRHQGPKPWSFFLSAWMEGAKQTRKATQQNFKIPAKGGAGNKQRGALRLRAPPEPKDPEAEFFLVINGASAGFGIASLPVVYPYKWVTPDPWEVDFVDANPIYWDGRSIEELKAEDVAASEETRKGTATDGVSQLIMRIRKTTEAIAYVQIKEGGGELSRVPFGRWKAKDGTYWRFMLYTPRETFGGGPMEKRPTAVFDPDAQPKKRIDTVLEVEELVLIGRDAKKDEDGNLIAAGPPQEFKALLARPPVVLIHGLKSEPMSCWVQTHSSGQSFAAMLERAGMMPFLVNYQNSNGLGDTRDSGYASNSRVLWSSPDSRSSVTYQQGWYQKNKEPQSWYDGPKATPILSDFQRVEKLRYGGIKKALGHYRDELEIAATQADVVGHSMGGVLSRVYASRPDYRRTENFNKGDIHRLITICSPHFGSDLAEVKDALMGGTIADEAWGAWARRNLTQRMLAWLLDPEPGAIRDLRAETAARPPEGAEHSAAASIGATPIPSFAIAASIDSNQLGIHPYDTGPEFRYLYTLMGFIFFNNRPLLDEFIVERAQTWRTAGKLQRATDRFGRPPAPEGELGLPGAVLDWGDPSKYPVYTQIAGRGIDKAAYYWEMRREGETREAMRKLVEGAQVVPWGLLDGGVDFSAPVDTLNRRMMLETLKRRTSEMLLGGDITKLERAAREMDIPVEVIGFVRDLIFHGDTLNDGAVRVTSQIGGLDDAHVHFRGMSHFMAPWHYKVIRKTIDLLKWDDYRFARDGFPTAGQHMPHWLPSATFLDDRVEGALAVDWSGMVRAHAVAYGEVSDRHNVVIIARPVNHDSTPLIAGGAATKGMQVKGKSSNWGPQAGFICRKQRFSKIWKVFADEPRKRDEEIKKYNAVTEKMLAEGKYPTGGPDRRLVGRPFAVPRALALPIKKPTYEVLIDPGETDAEQAVYLRGASDLKLYSPWNSTVTRNGKRQKAYDPARKPRSIDPGAAITARLIPMEVMADGLSDEDPKPYLTADYDLLAIGFHRPGMGAQTPPEVRSADFDDLLGSISSRQIAIVKRLNEAVARTGYAAGYVTHHGPENQYKQSPYVDYPLLVFDPGEPNDGDAEIFLIRQGPVGFRDIHLKRYFTEKIREDYNMYPNPSPKAGWLWETVRDFSVERGFAPQDAATLPPYVDEQPRPRRRPSSKPPAELAPRLEHGDGAAHSDFADTLNSDAVNKSFHATLEDARSGHARSMFDMGFYYANTDSEAKDTRKALLWYAAAARENDHRALSVLANRAYSGRGLPKDLTRAHDLYTRAAHLGSGTAANGLGWFYQNGLGVERSYDKARDWYSLGVERGDAWAMVNLGNMYRRGRGVEKDAQRALELYTQSAEEGLANGEYRLGKCYFDGTGVTEDRATAVEWYRKAAEQGYADAMLALGNAYLNGHGVTRSTKRGLPWLHKAADKGEGMALNNIGAVYHGGLGVKRDTAKGVSYFKKAAYTGVKLAQRNLARAYRDGKGVKRNRVEAYAWFSIAAAGGDTTARADLKTLSGELSRNDRSAGSTRAKALRTKIKD